MMKRTLFLTLCFTLSVLFSYSQETIIFTETMGTPDGTTSIADHQDNNGFDNNDFIFSGDADLRTTTASTGYDNASGGGNVFITSTIGRYFQIEGVNTEGYTNLTLSFGHHKSTNASSNELAVEVSEDGSNWEPLTYSRPTGSGTSNWLLITPEGDIPATENLRIRFTQTSDSPMFRVDDISLTGTSGTNPIITVNPTLLTGFIYQEDEGPSEIQSFTASGSNLIDDIIIDLPSDFELSLINDPFTAETDNINIEHVEGTVTETTIFVRLKEDLGVNTYNEIITINSDDADEKSVSLQGTVTSPEPTVIITSPQPDAIISDETVDIEFSIYNFELITDGFIAYSVNAGETLIHNNENPIEITGLTDGLYTVVLELVDDNEQSFDPAITDEVSFTVELPSAEASISITSPQNQEIILDSDLDIEFEILNFEINIDGLIAYSINGGENIIHNNENPIELTGLSNDTYIVILELVDMDEQSFDPVISDQVEFTVDIPTTSPELIIVSPTQGSYLYETDIDIVFELNNFTLNTDGKIMYSVNGGENIEHTVEDPIALTGLEYNQYIINMHLVDMNDLPLDPEVNATTHFTIMEPLPGGMETFDNLTASGTSYTSGTFQGQDGSTWTYVECRGDYEITGKAIMIGRNRTPQSNFYSGIISGGVGIINFDYKQAFGTNVNLNVYINDVLVGNVTSNDEQGVIKNSGDIIVNQHGDFVIKFMNANNNDGQVVVDNVAWSGFMTDDPFISITSPTNGQIFYSNNVTINYNIYNFEPGTDGFIEYIINEDNPIYVDNTQPIELTELDLGDYTATLRLVDLDENPLEPNVSSTVNFSIAELELTSIYDIQFTEDPNGDSPLVGEDVTTTGIVTATDGNHFWLQDGVGAWNGIYIFNNNFTGPQIGDEVIVSGTVTEHFGLTEIEHITALEILTVDNELPAPTVLSTGEAGQEMYESVLIQVTGVCVNENAGYGMWEINDGSGTLLIDDDLYDHNATLNHSYTITGVLDFSYNEYKILPRFEEDVIDNGLNENPFLSITYPTTATVIYQNNVNVTFSVSNFTLGTDGKVKWTLNDGEPSYVTSSPINIQNLNDGSNTIVLTLTDMDNDVLDPLVSTAVTFTVDLSGPDFTDIYDIQFTENPDGNSPLQGQYVWVKAVVSANFNGTTYGEGYYLQQGPGAWNGIYVYDLNNSPEIGDSVTLRGQVDEYHGMTQLKNISEYTVFDIGGYVADPVIVSTGDLASMEQYESVLVKVVNAECITSQNNFGEWIVNDGSGDLICKDNGAFPFNEVVGHIYNITGVIFYGYGNFTLNYRIPSDIQDLSNINDAELKTFNVYPNPTSNVVYIETENIVDKISITDVLGKTLISIKPETNNTVINLEDLPAGLYFIQVVKNNNIHQAKVIRE